MGDYSRLRTISTAEIGSMLADALTGRFGEEYQARVVSLVFDENDHASLHDRARLVIDVQKPFRFGEMLGEKDRAAG